MLYGRRELAEKVTRGTKDQLLIDEIKGQQKQLTSLRVAFTRLTT